MPENWKTYKLENLASIKGGKRMPKGVALIETPTRHPYIRVTDMGERKVSLDQLLYVPNEVYDKISRYIVSKEDVILSIVGTIGAVAIIHDELHNANLTENCVKLTELKDIHHSFLYYFLKSNIGKNEISKGVVGSTQPKLPLYNIQNIEIDLPPLQEQKSIASILSALDDKIELNLQMNKTLEEMAMALYKHWFVDFGPFQDGEFVDSEIGDIPKGWEVKKLNDLIETLSKGTTPTKKDIDGQLGEVPFLKVKDVLEDGSLKFSSIQKIPRKVHEKSLKRSILKSNDILISIAGTIGRVSLVPEQLNNSNCNQALAFIRLKEKNKFLYQIYFWLKSAPVQNEINSSIVQGVQANVSLTVLKNLDLIFADLESQQNFNVQVKPIFHTIFTNREENQTLTQLRDTLLPKLISGEVRVKDVEKTLSEIL